ncbi:hypothetical protein LIER_05503 [Lithospermum erythrorhizon]|uniref:Uncharacterized protein n=1 Tax=Lithospermum erythrorhizon TaxID=34254 RepID=A0AAV3P0W9_LITER
MLYYKLEKLAPVSAPIEADREADCFPEKFKELGKPAPVSASRGADIEADCFLEKLKEKPVATMALAEADCSLLSSRFESNWPLYQPL